MTDMNGVGGTGHEHQHGHADHSTSSENGAMGMEMPTIFISSTHVTLFFSVWTTTSMTTYFLSLLGLFLLAILNRFLAVLRAQLQIPSQPLSTSSAQHVPVLNPQRTRRRRPATGFSKARLSPLPLHIQTDRDEFEDAPSYPFSSSRQQEDEEEEIEENDYDHDVEEASRICLDKKKHQPMGSRRMRLQQKLSDIFRHWAPTAPWSCRVDGGRGLLEALRAFIGYILMLAVMTFNVGIFCAVLAGILVGEIVLGRHTPHSVDGWQDGACHNG
ncbi:copper transporter family protein [Aspergillus stella-maris]|uniref:copper transporter family protein n=1 Tax=Aspergillus stella-maris TaxID=1810926 RepID=UPI003CCD2119